MASRAQISFYLFFRYFRYLVDIIWASIQVIISADSIIPPIIGISFDIIVLFVIVLSLSFVIITLACGMRLRSCRVKVFRQNCSLVVCVI